MKRIALGMLSLVGAGCNPPEQVAQHTADLTCPLTSDGWYLVREVTKGLIQDALSASEQTSDPTNPWESVDASLSLLGNGAGYDFSVEKGKACAPQQTGCMPYSSLPFFSCGALSCESATVGLGTVWFSASDQPLAFAEPFSLTFDTGGAVTYQVPPSITWRIDWSTPGIHRIDARPMQSFTLENKGQKTDASYSGTTHVETSTTSNAPVSLAIRVNLPAITAAGVSLDVDLDSLSHPRGSASVDGQSIGSFTSMPISGDNWFVHQTWSGVCATKWGP
jgi:hypothetical protein